MAATGFLVLVCFGASLHAQVSITSQVPLTAMDICGATSTFSVTINCGAATNNNTLIINQPAGMHYVPGSVTVTATNASITVTENTISPDEDPVFNIGNMTPGNNVTFTYQAKADCQLIGVNNNNNILTFNGSAGSPAPHVTNGYNTRNGVMNITGVTNNSYLNRTLGDTYNRVITVRNGGQGSVTAFTVNIANGSGFQIQSITGGTPSAALPAQSTLVTITDFTGIGNGDAFFDNNEVITITETVSISGCNNLNTNYTATFGCFASADCGSVVKTTATATASVDLSKVPNLVSTITPTGNTPCNGVPFTYTINITNNGTGAATNVVWNFGANFGNGTYYYQNFQLNTGSGFAPVTPTSTVVVNTFCTVPPGGMNAGRLTIPLIAPGQTITLTMDQVRCCVPLCGPQAREFQGTISGATYQNSCGTTTYTMPTVSSDLSFFVYNGHTENGPAFWIDGDVSTKIFTYQNGPSSLGSLFSYSGGRGAFVWYVTLPPSLSWTGVPSNITFLSPTGQIVAAHSATLTGNVLRVEVRQSSLPAGFNINELATLRLPLTPVPGAPGGCGTQTISMSMGVIQDITCPNYCERGLGTAACGSYSFLVACPAPCPEGGTLPLSVSIRRTNLGLGDNNNDGLPNGTLDLSLIALDRVMINDTFRIQERRVISNPAGDMTWKYVGAEYSIQLAAATRYDVQGIGGTFRVWDASAGVYYDCNTSVTATTTDVMNDRRFVFDWGAAIATGCLPSGFVFDAGDSLIVNTLYRVAKNYGAIEANKLIAGAAWVSSVPGATGSERRSCLGVQGVITYAGLGVGFYVQASGVVTGCNQIGYNMNLGPSLAGTGISSFPFEYRKTLRPLTWSVDIPAGTTLATARLNSFNLNIAGVQSGNTLNFDFTKLFTDQGGTIPVPDLVTGFQLSIVLNPTCQVPQGVPLPLRNIRVVSDAPFLEGFFSPATITTLHNSSAVANIQTYFGNTFLGSSFASVFASPTYTAPSLSITPPTQTYTAFNSTATWDVTLTNASNVAIANNVWLAELPSANGITITSVQEINCTTGANIGAPLTSVNGIFQLGNMAAATARCFRLIASFTSCGLDSTSISTGYGCGGYPTSVGNLPNSCLFPAKLRLLPQTAGAQVTILQQPTGGKDLCEVVNYELLLSNPNLGTLGNVQVTLTLPASGGMSIEPGTSYLAYPNGGGYPGAPNLADPTYNALTRTFTWSIPNSLIGNLGGLVGTSNAPNNTFNLKFLARTTACDFQSGSLFRFNLLGTEPCGTPKAGTPQITQPLYLNGAPSNPNTWNVSFNATPLRPCGLSQNSTITFTGISNNGPNPSGATDFIAVLIPNEYTYAGNLTAGSNAPSGAPTVTNLGTVSEYRWPIPTGVPVGGMVSFSFDISATNTLACAAATSITTNTLVTFDATCIQAPNAVCNTSVVTGTASLNLSIERPQVTITAATATATLNAPTGENVSASVTISNTGTIALTAADAVTIALYGDANGNGSFDAADTQIGSVVYNGPLAVGAMANVNINALAPAGLACPLFALIMSEPCLCSASSITINSVPITPATLSYTTCPAVDLPIGTTAVTGYSYTWTPSTYLSSNIVARPTFNGPAAAATQTLNYTYSILRPSVINTCRVNIPVDITLNANPSVNAVGNQNLCDGQSTTAVNFTGTPTPGVVFKWVNNTPSIGLAANGTGNIAAFTALNPGNSPVVATITVTPEYTNNGVTCKGTPITFTITVNPTPTVNVVSNQILCAGETSTAINFSGNTVSNGFYRWTNDNPAIGIFASGLTNVPAFVAINTGNTPLVANFTVTPASLNSGIECLGTPQTFTITVNPKPAVTAIATNQICSPASPANIALTIPAASGYTYLIVQASDCSTCATQAAMGIPATSTTLTFTDGGAALAGTGGGLPGAALTTSGATYTIRVFNSTIGCYTDVTRTVSTTECCTNPSVSTLNACIGAGTVTFTQTGGTPNGTWSVDGGGTIDPATGVFTPTTAGCFTATYNTPVGGCTDSETFVVFPVPSITAPANTCASAFTLPTVSAVSGFTVEYSIDGAAYATAPVLPSTPGCHTISARYVLTATCGATTAGTAGTGACGVSNTVNVVIFPTVPTIAVPTTTCTLPITLPTVVSVSGFNVEYSIDGAAFSTNPTLPTTEGCHMVTVRYALATACGTIAAGTADPGSCGVSNTIKVCSKTKVNCLACKSNVNVSVGPNCKLYISPGLVMDGFSECENGEALKDALEVLIADGNADSYVDCPGTYDYIVQLKKAYEGCFEFTPCWGKITAEDKSGPKIASAVFAPDSILCKDVNLILNNPKSIGLPGADFRSPRQTERTFGAKNITLVDDELMNLGMVSFRENCDCNNACAVTVKWTDKLVTYGCDSINIKGVWGRIYREWVATDCQGMRKDTVQVIVVKRPVVNAFKFVNTTRTGVKTQTGTAAGAPNYDWTVEYNACTPDKSLIKKEDWMPSLLSKFHNPPSLPLHHYLDGFECNYSTQIKDTEFPICGGKGVKIDRELYVFDWCKGGIIDTFHILIKIGDFEAPSLEYAHHAPNALSTGPMDCTAAFPISIAGIKSTFGVEVKDNCGVANVSVRVKTKDRYVKGILVAPNTWEQVEYAGMNGMMIGLPVGTHRLIIDAYDGCYNAKKDSFDFEVKDKIAPVMKCDDDLHITLSNANGYTNGYAQVNAADIDEGSWDNCKLAWVRVRRNVPANCTASFIAKGYDSNGNGKLDPMPADGDWTKADGFDLNGDGDLADFGETFILKEGKLMTPLQDIVEFFCCDLSERVTIEFWGEDASGNRNFCWNDLLLEDKVTPTCIAPWDVTIYCDDKGLEKIDDRTASAAIWGDVRVSSGDDCAALNIEYRTVKSLKCGAGYIDRIWTLTKQTVKGPITITCSQRIKILPVREYNICFPKDISTDCKTPIIDTVIIDELGCDILAVNVTDKRYDASDDECYKIFRTYSVINWCTYDDRCGDPLEQTNISIIDRAVFGNYGKAPIYLLVRDRENNRRDGIEEFYISKDLVHANADDIRVYPPYCTVAEEFYHSFIYTQIIKVYDEERPVITGIRDTFCTDPAACTANITKVVTIKDNCTNLVELERQMLMIAPFQTLDAGKMIMYATPRWSVKELSGGQFEIKVSNLPEGTHDLIVVGRDECGNLSVATRIPFVVKDCKAPAPICINGLSTELMPDGNGGGMMAVWASDFVASKIYDCNGQGAETKDGLKLVTKYSINRVGEKPNANQTSLNLTCADAGKTILVELHAWDEAGNHDFCVTYIEVQDNRKACAGSVDAGEISGLITTDELEPVLGVNVDLSGGAQMNQNTGSNGVYLFGNLTKGSDFTVSPQLDKNHINGVSTFDLVQIQKHILGSKSIDNPYRMIAADVNNSKSITTIDMIQIRKLILNIDTKFTSVPSWKFVDASYQFPDPSNPWSAQFPEVANVNDLAGKVKADFIAIKMGDVNGNASASGAVATETRSDKAMIITTDEQQLQSGQSYTVVFKAKDLAKIQGYQFTLSVDPSLVTIEGIDYNGVMKPDNFGIFTQNGMITTSFVRAPLAGAQTLAGAGAPVTGQPQGLPLRGDEILFTLNLKAKSNTALSSALILNSRLTNLEAYNQSDEVMGVQLAFGAEAVAERTALHQNVPNPFSEETAIGFYLPKATKGVLTIRDVKGALIYRVEGNYPKGNNVVNLKQEQLRASGVLYYTLETADFTDTKKMMLLQK